MNANEVVYIKIYYNFIIKFDFPRKVNNIAMNLKPLFTLYGIPTEKCNNMSVLFHLINTENTDYKCMMI